MNQEIKKRDEAFYAKFRAWEEAKRAKGEYGSMYEFLIETLEAEGKVERFSIWDLMTEEDWKEACAPKGNLRTDWEGVYLPPNNL